MKYLSKNEKQTKKIAEQLAKKLKGGEVIALTGNLGAGKTTFIQGLAKGLKIKKNVNSPTFVLMKIYPVINSCVLCLCHIDAYRIQNPMELADIGALEYFKDKNTVSIIEWADKIKNILPKKSIEIIIKHCSPSGIPAKRGTRRRRVIPRGKKENERTIDINYKKS